MEPIEGLSSLDNSRKSNSELRRASPGVVQTSENMQQRSNLNFISPLAEEKQDTIMKVLDEQLQKSLNAYIENIRKKIRNGTLEDKYSKIFD